jgi:hypothetical protein
MPSRNPTPNTAAPELNAKARAAVLGGIDIFLSHSWTDSPSHKFAALKGVADKFTADKARTPLLWLDRACLNQDDISGSLAHLPVHMAGCKSLLVIAGASYTSRIWTLLELFVWVAMGKEQQKIRVLPILGGGASSEEDVLTTFRNVSAMDARCYSPADHNKIITIIESSYGTVRSFDKYVARLLALSGGENRHSRKLSTLGSSFKRLPSRKGESGAYESEKTKKKKQEILKPIVV